MEGRRLPSGRDIHYYDDWCSGWRQVLRKRVEKRRLAREDRKYQKSLLAEQKKEIDPWN